MNEKIPTERHVRMITCILPAGVARGVMDKLYKEKGVMRVGIFHARGVGGSGSFRSTLAEQTEKDVLVTLVPGTQADEIFNYLFEAAGINRPHGGFMYMQRIAVSTALPMPEPEAEPAPAS